MSKAKEKVLLAVGVILIVLASFRYETHSANTWTHYNGPTAGAGIAFLIGVVLLFKLIRLWADILVDRGRISQRPSFRSDWLILAVILAPALNYMAQGELIRTAAGELKPSWLFEWGPSECKEVFILSVIALSLLLRIYAVTRALLPAHKDLQPTPEADAS